MGAGMPAVFWRGDAKWITIVFAVYLGGLVVLVLSGFPKSILSDLFLVSALVSTVGFAVGLNSSRLFGGRKNFVGKMLLLFSTSVLLSGLIWIVAFVAFPSVPNLFLDTPPAVTGLFLLSSVIAAYALISSARAVVLEFNSIIRVRILVAFVFTVGFALLNQEAEVLAGLTFLGSFELSAPYYIIIFALIVGALVLISQLGRWYATPGIRMIAYGYIYIGIVPTLVRSYLLVSNIEYLQQVTIFFTSITVPFYFISLGMSRVRPRRLESAQTNPEP